MNILFVSFDADPPYMGGTATVINVLARAFQSKGHFVALGYFDVSDHPSDFFKWKIKLGKENRINVLEFIKVHKFDIIYNALAVRIDFPFEELKIICPPNCKIISAYHNKPLLRYLPLESLLNIFYESNNWLYKLYTLAKIPMLPIWKYQSQKKDIQKFHKMVHYSDKIQLLSNKFFPVFFKIVPNANKNKLVAIGNPIVFSEKISINKLLTKKKKVLVVCSVNYQKRVQIMLKIWAEIEKDKKFSDWSFDFVGGGDGFCRIIQMANNLDLKRIKFIDFQNPQKFYERSSIFMMTSRFEGWPMVLMEAMQMGVVPIVYNSFESVDDIIDDGKDGLIIANNDQKLFVDKLKELMINENLRLEIATNAINKCEHFTIDKICKKYLNLFYSVLS